MKIREMNNNILESEINMKKPKTIIYMEVWGLIVIIVIKRAWLYEG